MTDVNATFYMQFEPEWSMHAPHQLLGAKAIRMTLNRPEVLRGGAVAVKLTARISADAFEPLRAEVVVAEDMTVATPVEVTATDPAP